MSDFKIRTTKDTPIERLAKMLQNMGLKMIWDVSLRRTIVVRRG